MEVNIIKYGEVTHGVCPDCTKCCDYHLSADYGYKRIFFLTLHGRKQKYYLICKNCGAYTHISEFEARPLIERNFEDFERKRKRSMRYKNALSLARFG